METLENGEAVVHARHLLEKIEEVQRILSKMSLENTMTLSFITSKADLASKDYDQRYLANMEEYHRCSAILSAWFPEVAELAIGLEAAMNRFWGIQQHLLYVEGKGDSPQERAVMQEARDKIPAAEKDVEELIGPLRKRLSQLADQIGRPFREQ